MEYKNVSEWHYGEEQRWEQVPVYHSQVKTHVGKAHVKTEKSHVKLQVQSHIKTGESQVESQQGKSRSPDKSQVKSQRG